MKCRPVVAFPESKACQQAKAASQIFFNPEVTCSRPTKMSLARFWAELWKEQGCSRGQRQMEDEFLMLTAEQRRDFRDECLKAKTSESFEKRIASRMTKKKKYLKRPQDLSVDRAGKVARCSKAFNNASKMLNEMLAEADAARYGFEKAVYDANKEKTMHFVAKRLSPRKPACKRESTGKQKTCAESVIRRSRAEASEAEDLASGSDAKSWPWPAGLQLWSPIAAMQKWCKEKKIPHYGTKQELWRRILTAQLPAPERSSTVLIDEYNRGAPARSPPPPVLVFGRRRPPPTSRFVGVCWHRKNEQWRVQYRDASTPPKRKSAGYYADDEQAALAYNKAVTDAGLAGVRELNRVDASGRPVSSRALGDVFYTPCGRRGMIVERRGPGWLVVELEEHADGEGGAFQRKCVRNSNSVNKRAGS